MFTNQSVVLRAIAVQALRYTLPDDNEAFDAFLKNFLVDMLKTSLGDTEMEIRRHAMSTLTSAAHNKPELILAHLNQLMPFVMNETVIKPELIREVQMGPFKHIIDDGLEVRKVCRRRPLVCDVLLMIWNLGRVRDSLRPYGDGLLPRQHHRPL